MILIIYYFNPLHFDQIVFSIDNVVLDFYVVRPPVREQLSIIIDRIASQGDAQVVRWYDTKPGTFCEQTSIRSKDGTSFWMGVGLNGKKTDKDRCRIEFNPNKTGSNPVFIRIMQYLYNRTTTAQRKVARFDLAIDIPVSREQCFLVKDRRLYIERRHGQEYTQYLGAKSSKVGRVKLYNKALESNLNYPLTRLELTLNPAKQFEEINWPVVYYMDTPNMQINQIRVTETERFILRAILNGAGSLNDLGRKTRAKVQMILQQYINTVEFKQAMYESILELVHEYETGSILTKN